MTAPDVSRPVAEEHEAPLDLLDELGVAGLRERNRRKPQITLQKSGLSESIQYNSDLLGIHVTPGAFQGAPLPPVLATGHQEIELAPQSGVVDRIQLVDLDQGPDPTR